MKEKLKTFFSVCVLVLAIPYIVTLLFQGNQTSMSRNEAKIIRKEEGNLPKEEDSKDVEDYLPGVLAKEIPLDYHMESLKAQAVIARTNLVKAWGEKGKEPESMTVKEMMELWGQKGFEENYRLLEQAAEDTKGQILTWQDQTADAAYHAVSAGKTRSAKEALGREDQPYLTRKESSMDIPSPNYLKVIFLEKTQLLEKLKKADKEIKIQEADMMENIRVIERDSSGYVTKIKTGDKELAGEEFRRYLELNSACFYIKEVEGKVRILTKGLGHGLGLSQYGANEMAKEGKDYKQILEYYYSGLSLVKK